MGVLATLYRDLRKATKHTLFRSVPDLDGETPSYKASRACAAFRVSMGVRDLIHWRAHSGGKPATTAVAIACAGNCPKAVLA